MKPARLGDITTHISSGSTPRGGSETYLDSGPVMLIRSQNVRMNTLTLDDVAYITNETNRLMKRSQVHPGDVLLNITGASIGRVACFDLNKTCANVNQHVCIIRPRSDACLSRYLAHLIASPGFQEYILRIQHGGTRQALTFAQIADFKIPLPPLSEQKRIAEILDRAESLRRQRRAALALLDELTQSIFLDMFGDPVSNPKGWKQSTVAELCGERADNCVGGPFGSDLTQADYVESPGVPVVRGQNLSTDEPFMSEKGFVFVSDAKARKLSRNTAIRGDVLVSQRGARLAGQVALIPPNSQYEHYIVSQSQMRIRPDTSVVDPLYLVYYFRSGPSVRRMESLTISTGVPHINLGILRNFVVEVPDIKLQREFVSRAGKVSKLKATVQKAETSSDSLFASLQHRAFRGEL
jgi:type I restriction enzyme, S subunit